MNLSKEFLNCFMSLYFMSLYKEFLNCFMSLYFCTHVPYTVVAIEVFLKY